VTGEAPKLWRRAAAIVYDVLLLSSLWFLATIRYIVLRRGEYIDSGSGLLHVAYQLTLLLVAYAFFVGFWTSKGRTLGMQSWGLQLQSEDGGLPTRSAATIRFFAAFLSLVPLGLGFLWQLWDPRHLTWHDHLSKTRLVYYPRQSAS
jgi:uncharacterized RDD family membrane protein YckC